MSATPLVSPGDLPASRTLAPARPRRWVRALSFAALALYGVERWGRLMHDPPTGRLLGLALIAVALAVFVPLVRHLTAGWPAPAGRALRTTLVIVLILAALPAAGLPLQWAWHLRVAVSARAIGAGLGSLGGVLVPYLGSAFSIRLVMTLGAALLLLDAGVALAFAGPELGDGRRAAAALPLIALAVVPATLVRPSAPALQGLILFLLLAAFLWGERLADDATAAAVGLACAAGLAGAIVGPIIEGSRPWVDYRAWAGTVSASELDRFDWNQSYAPLYWPHVGRVVISVRARRGDYWQAEQLTAFNGVDWVSAPSAGSSRLPIPSPATRRRWTQAVTVTIDGMQTDEVIGGEGTSTRPQLAGGTRPGAVPGTWIARRPLTPGDAYTVQSYSPSPSPQQLARPGRYPWRALAADLTLTLPDRNGGSTTGAFPHFHAAVPRNVQAAIDASPYAGVFALARRMAQRARTPEAFAEAVERYLDGGQFTYEQRPPSSTYPLLDFLLHSRTGYCQQFSGAMALLLRMGGVPARIGAGFTSGQLDPGTRTWTVSDIDAHAWDEVWFPRVGWVRFDPTPAADPALGGHGGATGGADPRASGIAPDLKSTLAKTQAAERARQRHSSAGAAQPRAGSPSRRRAQRRGDGAGAWPWVAGAGLVLLVALLAVGASRRGGGERRWRGASGRGGRALRARDPLAELERALARTGRPLDPRVTLAALEQRFHDSPEAAGYVRSLRLSRYGAGADALSPGGRRAVRAELAAGLGLRGRLRALWALPPRP